MKQFEKQKQAIIAYIRELREDGIHSINHDLNKIIGLIHNLTPKAKQLEWIEQEGYTIFKKLEAKTNVIKYGIKIYRNGKIVWYRLLNDQEWQHVMMNSVEKAQEAAQEHYNKLVLEQIA